MGDYGSYFQWDMKSQNADRRRRGLTYIVQMRAEPTEPGYYFDKIKESTANPFEPPRIQKLWQEDEQNEAGADTETEPEEGALSATKAGVRTICIPDSSRTERATLSACTSESKLVLLVYKSA